MRGKGQKTKIIAREVAYHGTTLGALSATGITELRSQFEPLAPGGCHVPNTNLYRHPDDRDPMILAEAIDERICFEGPETVAAVILEPVQNAGGCFVPPDGYFQRVRAVSYTHLDVYKRQIRPCAQSLQTGSSSPLQSTCSKR